jgi:hypothetical protein
MIQIDQPSRPLWLPVAIRRHGLFVVTALAIAVARQIHTHKVLWHSLGDFVLASFMGYATLAVIFMTAGVLISMWGAGSSSRRRPPQSRTWTRSRYT